MQSQMKRYSIPRPDQTAGQFRFRQSGASFHRLPSFCRDGTMDAGGLSSAPCPRLRVCCGTFPPRRFWAAMR